MLIYPLLAADIGGTNCRVAVVDRPGDPPRVVARFATHDTELPTAESALMRAASLAGVKPRSAVLAVAGPIIGKRADLTNAGWRFDGPELARAMQLEQGLLVNDFEALAAVLPSLAPDDMTLIKPGRAIADGTRLVLGPGTGFGAAALIGRDGRYTIVPTEAGHIEVGPIEPDEFTLWPAIEKVDGRITIESLLSGDGLTRLDAACRMIAGKSPAHRNGAEVQSAAEAGDRQACDAIALFGRLLARIAGDLALAFKATGGVFIAGGIAPKLLPLWDTAAMARTFANKPPMEELMADFPLALITGADPAERGLAKLALDPAAFGLEHRLWL